MQFYKKIFLIYFCFWKLSIFRVMRMFFVHGILLGNLMQRTTLHSAFRTSPVYSCDVAIEASFRAEIQKNTNCKR